MAARSGSMAATTTMRPRANRPLHVSCASASAPAGMSRSTRICEYGRRVEADKRQILSFLIDLKAQGLSIAAYGAPAKGNTLLNYCGIRGDFIDFTCDLNPHKQGHFLPGSHIPIRAPEAIREEKPDVVLILPWNLKDEIMEQLAFIREWGGRFAVRTPELELHA